jgi:hypothetical protein
MDEIAPTKELDNWKLLSVVRLLLFCRRYMGKKETQLDCLKEEKFDLLLINYLAFTPHINSLPYHQTTK